MKLDKYELNAGSNFVVFEFVSEGPQGAIKKLIQFTETTYSDVYNLAFGDEDALTGNINDLAISNNGDSEKVLATVVSAVIVFTEKHPDAWVYARGSTQSRTRLYRIGITKYIAEISNDFEVYGQIKNEWEIFRINVEYDAFLAQRKKH
jgi:hypothetical protein